MLNSIQVLRGLLLTLSLGAIGCHAQTLAGPGAGSVVPQPLPGSPISPELARRVDLMIRSRTELPPQLHILVGGRTGSTIPGFDQIAVTFVDGANVSKPLIFFLSDDGKTLAQFNKFDISQDPKLKVPAGDRPSRGGPANAPVTVVLFDDLECPFCSKMHAEMFPAVTERYKNQVRVVYRDFPLDQHPWAVRAAIDANCIAAASQPGYWNYVDYVHAHASELGGDAKTLAVANETLDKLATDEGARQKVSAPELAACIKKQDGSKIEASKKEAEALGVNSTPALFINGEKVEGAIPIEYVYRAIDDALTAAGVTPPARYVPPAATAAAPAKSGS